MDFKLDDMTPLERYKLVTGAVVPRPIAFVSSLSAEGLPNAAPFSFFNAFGASPPVVVLGINTRPGGHKDSYNNILATRDFVINVVDYPLVERMNACSGDYGPEVDEAALTGLTLVPSVAVKAPRIAGSPIHLECVFTQTVEAAPGRMLVLGEVVHIHAEDAVLRNGTTIDQHKLDSVGRMGGPWYCRTTDMFALERPVV